MSFNVVVIGWDPGNLLQDAASAPLQDGAVQLTPYRCPNCITGRRAEQSTTGLKFVPTNSAEIHVLEFADEATAEAWMQTHRDALVGKQIIGFVPTP